MPPKCKFTRNEIIQAALDMVRKEGIASVTARGLGVKLGSSSKPIFSIFENMEEVQAEVQKAAKALYDEYVKSGLEQSPTFKSVGMRYILFARNETNLFQLLFMSDMRADKIQNILSDLDGNCSDTIYMLQNKYSLDKEKATRLYIHMGIYSHGIAVLLANKTCNFSEQEIEQMLSEAFTGILCSVQKREEI